MSGVALHLNWDDVVCPQHNSRWKLNANFTLSRGLQYQNIHAFKRFSTVSAAAVPRSGGDGFREDGGDLVGGEGKAGVDGGEGGGELRVVFANVLCGGEEVVVAGLFESVADGGPETVLGEGCDEAAGGKNHALRGYGWRGCAIRKRIPSDSAPSCW